MICAAARGLPDAVLRAAALAAALAAGCGRREMPPPPERIALDARFAGCASVRAGPVCEVPPEGASLRVFVPIERGAITVTAGGAPLPAPATPLPGGLRISIPLPPAAEGAERAIEVCVPRAARLACRSIPTIAVARDERVARAIALRRANDPGGALAVLAGIGDPEASRARAVSLRARIALASGDAEAAVTGLSEGMETHLAAGRISDAGLDAFALAHTLVTHRSAFENALVALDRAARQPLEVATHDGAPLGLGQLGQAQLEVAQRDAPARAPQRVQQPAQPDADRRQHGQRQPVQQPHQRQHAVRADASRHQAPSWRRGDL